MSHICLWKTVLNQDKRNIHLVNLAYKHILLHAHMRMRGLHAYFACVLYVMKIFNQWVKVIQSGSVNSLPSETVDYDPNKNIILAIFFSTGFFLHTLVFLMRKLNTQHPSLDTRNITTIWSYPFIQPMPPKNKRPL